jgi:hypothetical protein
MHRILAASGLLMLLTIGGWIFSRAHAGYAQQPKFHGAAVFDLNKGCGSINKDLWDCLWFQPNALLHLLRCSPWPHRPLAASGKFARGHFDVVRCLIFSKVLVTTLGSYGAFKVSGDAHF